MGSWLIFMLALLTALVRFLIATGVVPL